MPFSSHLLEFFGFLLIGVTLGIIFDFFRAYRKLKKSSVFFVTLQDIIFFIIATIIILLSIIFILDTEIRFYIFLAIGIGIYLYIKIFSRFILKIIVKFYEVINNFLGLIFLPISLIITLFKKIYQFLKKIIKKCCKKFLYVISILHKVIFCKLLKQKKVKNNDKKSRKKKRKKGNKQKK